MSSKKGKKRVKVAAKTPNPKRIKKNHTDLSKVKLTRGWR